MNGNGNMRQVVLSLGVAAVRLCEVAKATSSEHEVCKATKRSLISAGTERMLLDFGRANWLEKARQQPDKVKQVLQKIKTDGVGPTLEAVRAKLDQPVALGLNVGW